MVGESISRLFEILPNLRHIIEYVRLCHPSLRNCSSEAVELNFKPCYLCLQERNDEQFTEPILDQLIRI